jgi:DNA-binding MarR family transcriptional regulator
MHDDQIRRFRTQMRMLGRRLRRELPPVRGVSRSAVQVLRVVSRATEPSPGDVAERLRMTSSNVAATLRELESAGLVRRLRDPRDRRRVRLSITAAGADAIACVHAERDTWLGRAIEAVLDEHELRTLLAAGALMQRLAEYDDDATADGEIEAGVADAVAPDRAIEAAAAARVDAAVARAQEVGR